MPGVMLGLAKILRPRLVANPRKEGPSGLPLKFFELRLIVYVDSLGDQNPLVKQIRRAVSHGTLTQDGYAVAEGLHLLEEALRAGREIRAVILSEAAKPGLLAGMSRDLSRLPEPRQVSEKTFRSLSSTETPQGVLALVKPPAADLAKMLQGEERMGSEPLIAILDGVQDPGNAGAIVRVAEAFGATGMIFLKGTVGAFHPRTLRGSAGSSFRLPVIAGRDLDLDLDALGALRVFSAMPAAMPAAVPANAEAAVRSHESSSIELRDADFTVPCAIAIGAEGRGVSERLAARSIAVHIPTRNVESLNAAVAAGILFYEADRQRRAKQGSPGRKNSNITRAGSAGLPEARPAPFQDEPLPGDSR